MKAILIDGPGGPEVLRYGDTETPRPVDDELLVRVRAVGVNRADVLQRMGGYNPPPGASPILGLELAGEVVKAVGPWQVGDRVMAVVSGGAYAEYAAVPVGMAMRIPDNLSDEQAAAIPEAFLTAYLNLFVMAALNWNEVVLIHAGGSGVGSAAIQLARQMNARVFATAGKPDKLERCRQLGAEIAVNYHEDSFGRVVLEATGGRGVDVILDFVGEPYWNENLAALARGGRLMLIGFLGGSRGNMDLRPILGKNLTVRGTTLRGTPLPQKIELTQAFSDFALPRFQSGELFPIIDSVYPLADAAEAHRHMEDDRNFGKIILTVP